MKIYVAKNGSQLGPYTLTEVQQLRQSGQVLDTDLAWHEGLTDWVPLQQIEGLAVTPASPLPIPTFPTGASLQKQTPVAARILTALALFSVLFVFFTILIWIISLFIGGVIVGSITAAHHTSDSPEVRTEAMRQAGQVFGKTYVFVILGFSALASSLLSALSAWALAFSNLLPWCARK